jgi:putative NADH-flavin reductase
VAVATSRRGAKTKNAVRTLLRPRRSWVKWFEEIIDQSWIAYDNRNCSERASQDISFALPARASCLEREESAMRVVLLGASGFVGSAILKEALDRGHLVTAVFRNQGHFNPSQQLKIQITDVYDSVALAAVIVGHDALISAFNPGWKDPTLYADQVRGTTSILKAVKSAAIKRVLWVGGAGGLEVKPGVRVVDARDFPAAIKPGSLATIEALDQLRRESTLDWSFLSPSANMKSGARTGQFRLGNDQLLVDSSGHSNISVQDYAVAMINELEHPAHIRKRFTVGY